MSRSIIEVEGLSKRYRLGQFNASSLREEAEQFMRRMRGRGGRRSAQETDFWALEDVSFEVRPGEVVGIIGRNGAGKSTLLKILSRVTEPTRGEVRIRGRVASLLEVGTGFHPELSGRENIFLNGAILGMSRAEIAAKFDEIVAFSEVEKFLDTPVKRYSSGMYVRLAFAVAAHLESEVLIVDEVLAVGDMAFQRKSLASMDALSKQGRTVLIVSHNLGTIQSMCERAILLRDGHKIRDGEPAEVIAHYASQATDVGSSYEAPEDPAKSIQVRSASVNVPPTGVFDIQSEVEISVAYQVRKPLVGVALGVKLIGNGVIIFNALDTDDDRGLLQHRSPGDYATTVTIPRMFLKPGRYQLDVTVGMLNVERIDHVEAACAFDVVSGSMDDTFKSFSARRDGLVVSPVRWETRKREAAPRRPASSRRAG